MTEVRHVDPVHPDPVAVAHAAKCLQRCGLVAFPTETVYGLGAHALDPSAVRRIFVAKGRPATDPLIIHVADLDHAKPLVVVLPTTATSLAALFWPGPLTMVMRRSTVVPDEVTAGLDTVAIRVPAHPVARALLEAAHLPIAAPSANLFSRPSPTLASHVLDDLDGRIDMVLDAGPTSVGVESTVLDLTHTPPIVLRPGAITIEMLRDILPDVVPATIVGAPGGPLPSPGLLPRHYAPNAPLTLYQGRPSRAFAALIARAHAEVDRGRRVGVLVTTDRTAEFGGINVVVADLGQPEPAGVAARLYQALRELDAVHVDCILAVDFPATTGLWVALRDRLRRAATDVVQVD